MTRHKFPKIHSSHCNSHPPELGKNVTVYLHKGKEDEFGLNCQRSIVLWAKLQIHIDIFVMCIMWPAGFGWQIEMHKMQTNGFPAPSSTQTINMNECWIFWGRYFGHICWTLFFCAAFNAGGQKLEHIIENEQELMLSTGNFFLKIFTFWSLSKGEC